MPVDLPLVLYRDLLLYTVHGFLKWKMIHVYWIHGNLQLYFCVSKIWWSHLLTFQRFLDELFE